ncbi:hypothetical protein Naga_102283g1, partial [Nannochloropsis gaditana]
ISSAYLFCTTFLSLLWGQGAAQGVHAHAHPYTPPGKGRGLRGAFLSTHETGTGTGSGKGTAMVISVGLQIVVGVLGVASVTAAAVHHLDQRELAAAIKLAAAEMKRVEGERAAEMKRVEGERAAEMKRVEGERAAEIKLAAAEIKRVEGERRLSEERLRAELERYKYDLQLRHTQDYKPYQAAKEQANKERGGTGGPQKEEETD